MLGHFAQTSALYGAAVSDIGKPEFSGSLMRAIARTVARVDHCSIFQFDGDSNVRHVGTASFISLDKGVSSAERYAQGLHVYDPLRSFMNKATNVGGTPIFRLTPENVCERRYRDSLAQLHTIERMSVLARNGSIWYSLNLYRSRESGRFSLTELERLHDSAPLLASLAGKHSELIDPSIRDVDDQQIEDRLREHASRLSAREMEVCKLTLLGYRTEAIAVTLMLSAETVLTYRKRAYAKLKISSQNELFRLCLRKPSA